MIVRLMMVNHSDFVDGVGVWVMVTLLTENIDELLSLSIKLINHDDFL